MNDDLETAVPPVARLHLLVTGHVQGVGFRNFVQVRAAQLDLSGWVRNRWDGTVEAEAEGPRPALEQFLGMVRQGPRHAHVADLDFQWLPATGESGSFRVRATVSG
jgi:acylphosphatase